MNIYLLLRSVGRVILVFFNAMLGSFEVCDVVEVVIQVAIPHLGYGTGTTQDVQRAPRINVPNFPVVDFASNHRVTRRDLCPPQTKLVSSVRIIIS